MLKKSVYVVLALLIFSFFISCNSETPIVEKYKVDFVSDNITIASIEVEKGKTVYAPQVPAKEGFIMKGWKLEKSENLYDFSTPVNSDIRLYAVWDNIKVSVSFDRGEGIVDSDTQIINYGDVPSKPSDPVKEGFLFKGWKLKGNTEFFSFDYSIKENITLVAVWEQVIIPAEYLTVVFNTDGGSAIDSVIVEKGKTVSRPTEDPVKTGYTFEGWLLNGDAYDFSKPVNTDITLTASWKIIPVEKFTVTFNTDGGSAIDSVIVEKGKTVSSPAEAPVKTGYTFEGWLLNGDAYDFSKPVNTDITLTASWEIIPAEKFTVTFNTDGGSAIDSVIVEKGKTASRPTEDPVKTGYKFRGWKLNGAETLYSFDTPVNDNITLYAEWEIIKVNITFDCGDGASEISPQTINYGSIITKPSNPTRIGYSFIGWKEKNNSELFDFELPVINDITLQAQWEIASFTVSFYNSDKLVVSMECISGTEYQLPKTPSIPAGFTFTGWQQNGTESILTDAQKTFALPYSQDGYVFNAVYEKEPEKEPEYITVSFFTGSTLLSKQTYEANKDHNLPTPVAPYGMSFRGWQLRSTKEIISSDNTTFSLPYDEKEYVFDAVWYEFPITVTFMDGDNQISCDKYNRNTVYSVPTLPARKGYSFEGWYESNTQQMFNSTFSLPYSENEYVLTAVWSKVPVTVSFYNNGELFLTKEYEYDVEQVIPNSPEPQTGYRFLGWKESKSEELYDKSFTLSYTERTYVMSAVWERLPITVSFYENGNLIISDKYEYDKEHSFPDSPEKEAGYEFLGWQLRGTDQVVKGTFNNPYSTEIYRYDAVWKKLPFTVYFYYGDELIEKRQYINGEPQSSPELELGTGFTLKGWQVEGKSEVLSDPSVLPFSSAGYKCYAYIDTELLRIDDVGVVYGTAFLKNYSTITKIVIPDSIKGKAVNSIGNHAFSYCNRLTSITIPDSVTSIGERAFYDCSSLTSITIPDSVTSIGYWAFYGCSSLTSIAISDSVASIGEGAFNGCSSLKSITIPDSVTSIGNYAFYNCSSLTSINVSDNNQYYKSIDGVFFDKNVQTIIIYPCGKSSNYYAIPDSVTSIGNYAFYNCSSLTSINIPDSVTSIGEQAFYKCSSLTSITIPDAVTSIGHYAFYYCTSLNSITIPDSVTSIGTWAFYYCKSLTSIDIPDAVTSIGFFAFGGCSSLTNITIPDSVISIGSSAFAGCSSLKSITIPDSVISIRSYAFEGCSSLTSITIPDSVISIGSSAFERCSSLTSITIPDSVTSIGERAFYGCSRLTSITIPDSVTSIGSSTFDGCSRLTSITIPASVASIGNWAFCGCSRLTSITIPASVTSIGERAFYGCSRLTSITIPASVASIGNWAFEECSSLTDINIKQNQQITSLKGAPWGATNATVTWDYTD